MGKSNTDNGVQPPIRERELSYDSVFGFDSINDDEYNDLINNYKQHNNVVHNIYIDHIDHSGESDYHHHHLSTKDGHNNLNIVYHDHDCDPDDNLYLGRYYNEYDYDLDQYGPRNHNHSDDRVAEHGTT